jgi:hypothetical protein
MVFQNKLNQKKFLLVEMGTQMSFALNAKVWDVKGQVIRLIMKGHIEWPMGNSS